MKASTKKNIPRLPLDGSFDLTYRCNNNCRHCWVRLPMDADEKRAELSFDEICWIVDQARTMGCQAWSISGGEPMLRPDFKDIFNYITHKSIHYTINTNGTLITPEIARLLTKPGRKMVALYGATAEVHDDVTRNPGSFEATMRGFAYLREMGAYFEVQIIPMRANYHQYNDMISLAQSLSKKFRIGASWLFFSACRSADRNQQINAQRLNPKEVLLISQPNPGANWLNESSHSSEITNSASVYDLTADNDYLFEACITSRQDFHIDPYGTMSFCSFIKDPALRYDLRQGTFQEAWDEFIPSLSNIVLGGQEFRDNCGSCELRSECLWCPVYGFLEHGRYAAKVDYLCQLARESKRFEEEWKLTHRRYYQIAGMNIQLSADFPFTDDSFAPKFDHFRVKNPGDDTIAIRLVSGVPALSDLRLGKEVYRRPPWAIYQQRDTWVYMGIGSDEDNFKPYTVAIVNKDHNRMTICSHKEIFKRNNLHSLTTFTSDQILLAPALAKRQACYLHSSAIILNEKGLLFVGHSGAGKSTMLKMLRGQGEILCDDRNIVRRWPDGFRVHGTWSHGELPDVSPAGAPLLGIFFLEQAQTNQLIPITETRERLSELLAHVVRPLLTPDWWKKTLNLAGKIANEVPIYRLKFDKSGQVLDVLKPLYE